MIFASGGFSFRQPFPLFPVVTSRNHPLLGLGRWKSSVKRKQIHNRKAEGSVLTEDYTWIHTIIPELCVTVRVPLRVCLCACLFVSFCLSRCVCACLSMINFYSG